MHCRESIQEQNSSKINYVLFLPLCPHPTADKDEKRDDVAEMDHILVEQDDGLLFRTPCWLLDDTEDIGCPRDGQSGHRARLLR
jgi:hypothetical protein